MPSVKTAVLQSAVTTATADGNALHVSGHSTVLADVAITNTATVNFEAAGQSGTFVAVPASNAATGAVATTTTATGAFRVDVRGFEYFRARISGGSGSPSVTVKAVATDGAGGLQPVGTSGAIGAVSVTADPTYATIATGELAGSASAVQMPTITCKMVKFKAEYNNAGRVYIGSSTSVTKQAGTTSIVTGFELSAGEETGWLQVANLSVFWRICDNAGDDLTYIALAP